MKKILTLIALLLTVVGSRAADVQKLVVGLIDGSTIELALQDTPRLSFPDTRLVIESANFSTTIQRYRVTDVHFEGATDVEAITPLHSDGAQWRIDYTRPDEVIVSGPMKGHRVSLYTAGGVLLSQQPASSATQCRVPLSGLTAGVYVISIDGVTFFKISVR